MSLWVCGGGGGIEDGALISGPQDNGTTDLLAQKMEDSGWMMDDRESSSSSHARRSLGEVGSSVRNAKRDERSSRAGP
ncbi:MAG: hypothetical protein E4H02_08230 [Lentisphaerales bacterium]|nr:MAG: hypothetical protein E4H02_08230 [Lentisphaerales bacterium]